MAPFVECLTGEIRNRAPLPETGHTVGSVYLGGGTPSLLSAKQLRRIMKVVREVYDLSPEAEITLECNPDDLRLPILEEWQEMGVNRLSIGVQSFFRSDLELLRRSHDEVQAQKAVLLAYRAGFDNLNMDLIYGIPGQSPGQWSENLQQATSLPVSHLSAYHLTFEPGTVLEHWRKKGRIAPVPDEQSQECFDILREHTGNTGFDHYEISNFAKAGKYSRHNMVYWTGKAYTGFGPSAHSYDGTSRRWNISSLKRYMEGIREGGEIHEGEELNQVDRYHEYLITSLRTSRGVDTDRIGEEFGERFLIHFEKQSVTFLKEGTLLRKGASVRIDPGQWLITDRVLERLFLEDTI